MDSLSEVTIGSRPDLDTNLNTTTRRSSLETLKQDTNIRSLILFGFQLFIIVVVISASIYNLSTKTEDKTLWTSLLSSAIGYTLPNPVIKKLKQ